MIQKARVAVECLCGCSGCEMGIVDLHEQLLTVLEEIDLIRMPILMDIKEYGTADIGIITGSLRTHEDEEAAQIMRKKCKTIIAFGTCAVYGGPQGASGAHTNEEMIAGAFTHNPTTCSSQVPQNVPRLLPEIRPVDTQIAVDVYLPGCPPHAAYIFEGLMSILRNRKSSLDTHTVCYHCRRLMRRSEEDAISRFHEKEIDPSVCFLSQGVLCFGSVTLDRCSAPCPAGGIPCFSCGGPSQPLILEPQKDIRSEIAQRMARMTKIPYRSIVKHIERHAKTYCAYAMASSVFSQKPTFLLKKWINDQSLH